MIIRETIRRSQKGARNRYEIHATEFFPEPYPKYPVLVSRTIHLHEAQAIEELYRVSDIPPIGLDSTGLPLNYRMLSWKIATESEGEESLDPREEAYMQFANVLYFFCYDKHRLGEALNLTWRIRHARGALVRSTEKNVMAAKTLDHGQVDEILESALQRNDFEAIRAVLNYEGYGIPVNEPNDLVIPAEWDNDECNVFHDLEIQITPEEYEMWKAPLEACEVESAAEEPAIQKAFAEAIAENIPLRLERLIRQRDIVMLRMMLRLYGHAISPNQLGYQEDLSDEPPSKDNPHGTTPEPFNNS